MTFLAPEFDGDCHASVRYFIAMTGKSAAQQIPIVVIGFNKLIVKLEFVGELGIDSLRRGRVSRSFA